MKDYTLSLKKNGRYSTSTRKNLSEGEFSEFFDEKVEEGYKVIGVFTDEVLSENKNPAEGQS